MSEFQTSNPSEKQGNQLPNVGEYVGTLLSDETIKNLPETEQGKIIIDRFVGALVRHGEVKGNVDNYTPDRTLQLIADYMNGKAPDLRRVTSTEGLRAAAVQLSEDVRTGGLLNHVGELLDTEVNASTGKTEYTFTTPAQVEGYIQGGGRANHLDVYNAVPGVNIQGDEWAPILMEQVQRMSTSQQLTWPSLTDARGMMESSAPYIRNTGRDWQSAVYTAEKVGVDVNILKRSAEKIQRRQFTDNEDLGARAAFLATGGRISTYQDRLRSRSGM